MTEIYEQLRPIRLFFKYTKQHTKIKSVFEYAAGAIETQNWIANSI